MTRAAIYARISEDKELTGLGAGRQEEDCRKLVAARGWQLAGVFVDNDISAYSGKPRPDYNRLLTLVDAGEVDAIVAWHPDRLHRSPKELEGFIDLINRRQTEIATVTAGELDLSTPNGRMGARVHGAMASYESEHKAERIRRKHEEIALEGRRIGGGSRPFGLTADYGAIVPEEAELIRDAAHRVINGEGVFSIARDFERRGVVGPERPRRGPDGRPYAQPGKALAPATLRSILTKPTVIGRRNYKGQLAATRGWPAILDDETYARVRAILTRPERATAEQPARSYLLTGIARCGRCGEKLSARRSSHRVRRYICLKRPGSPGCGGVTVVADAIEELVARELIEAVGDGSLTDAVADELDDRAAIARIAELEARLEQLAIEHAVGDEEGVRMGDAEWRVSRKAILERIEAAQATVRETAKDHARIGALTATASWAELPFEQRLAVLGQLVEAVIVNPARRGAPRFEASRVKIVWRA